MNSTKHPFHLGDHSRQCFHTKRACDHYSPAQSMALAYIMGRRFEAETPHSSTGPILVRIVLEHLRKVEG